MFYASREIDNASSEVQQIRDSDTIEDLKHKTYLPETEPLEFGTALQNLKQISLSDQSEFKNI